MENYCLVHIPTIFSMPIAIAVPQIAATSATPLVVSSEALASKTSATSLMVSSEALASKTSATSLMVSSDSLASKTTATPLMVSSDSLASKTTATSLMVSSDSLASKTTATPLMVSSEALASKTTATSLMVSSEALASKSFVSQDGVNSSMVVASGNTQMTYGSAAMPYLKTFTQVLPIMVVNPLQQSKLSGNPSEVSSQTKDADKSIKITPTGDISKNSSMMFGNQSLGNNKPKISSTGKVSGHTKEPNQSLGNNAKLSSLVQSGAFLVPNKSQNPCSSGGTPQNILNMQTSSFQPVITTCYSIKRLTLRRMLELLIEGDDIMSYFEPGTDDFRRTCMFCETIAYYDLLGLTSEVPKAFYDSLISKGFSFKEVMLLKLSLECSQTFDGVNEIYAISECSDNKDRETNFEKSVLDQVLFPITDTFPRIHQIENALRDFEQKHIISDMSKKEISLIRKALSLNIVSLSWIKNKIACSKKIKLDTNTVNPECPELLKILTATYDTVQILDESDDTDGNNTKTNGTSAFHQSKWKCTMLADTEQKSSKDKHDKLLRQCYLCGLKFSTEATLLDHITNEHGKAQNSRQLLPNTRFTCSHCSKDFASLHFLQAHEIEFHLSDYPCYFCGLYISDRYDMLKHIAICHSEFYKCDICQAVYLEWSGVQKHFKDEHNIKCAEKELTERKILQNQLCFFCSKKFRDQQELISHINNSHIDTLSQLSSGIQCSSCRHTFMDESALIFHSSTYSRCNQFKKTLGCSSLKKLWTECLEKRKVSNKSVYGRKEEKGKASKEVKKLSEADGIGLKEFRSLNMKVFKYGYPLKRFYEYCIFSKSIDKKLIPPIMDQLVRLMLTEFPELRETGTVSDSQDILLALSRSHKFVRILQTFYCNPLPWNAKIKARINIFLSKLKKKCFKIKDSYSLSILLISLQKSFGNFEFEQGAILKRFMRTNPKRKQKQNVKGRQYSQVCNTSVETENSTKSSNNYVKRENLTIAPKLVYVAASGPIQNVQKPVFVMNLLSGEQCNDESQAVTGSHKQKIHGLGERKCSNQALGCENDVSSESDPSKKGTLEEVEKSQTPLGKCLRVKTSEKSEMPSDVYLISRNREAVLTDVSPASKRPEQEPIKDFVPLKVLTVMTSSDSLPCRRPIKNITDSTNCPEGTKQHFSSGVNSNSAKHLVNLSEEKVLKAREHKSDVKNSENNTRYNTFQDAEIESSCLQGTIEKCDSGTEIENTSQISINSNTKTCDFVCTKITSNKGDNNLLETNYKSLKQKKESSSKKNDLRKERHTEHDTRVKYDESIETEKSEMPQDSRLSGKNSDGVLTNVSSAHKRPNQDQIEDFTPFKTLKVMTSPDRLLCCLRNKPISSKSVRCSYVKMERCYRADSLSLKTSEATCDFTEKICERSEFLLKKQRRRPIKYMTDSSNYPEGSKQYLTSDIKSNSAKYLVSLSREKVLKAREHESDVKNSENNANYSINHDAEIESSCLQGTFQKCGSGTKIEDTSEITINCNIKSDEVVCTKITSNKRGDHLLEANKSLKRKRESSSRKNYLRKDRNTDHDMRVKYDGSKVSGKSEMPQNSRLSGKNSDAVGKNVSSAHKRPEQDRIEDFTPFKMLKVMTSPDRLLCCLRNKPISNTSVRCSYVKMERCYNVDSPSFKTHESDVKNSVNNSYYRICQDAEIESSCLQGTFEKCGSGTEVEDMSTVNFNYNIKAGESACTKFTIDKRGNESLKQKIKCLSNSIDLKEINEDVERSKCTGRIALRRRRKHSFKEKNLTSDSGGNANEGSPLPIVKILNNEIKETTACDKRKDSFGQCNDILYDRSYFDKRRQKILNKNINCSSSQKNFEEINMSEQSKKENGTLCSDAIISRDALTAVEKEQSEEVVVDENSSSRIKKDNVEPECVTALSLNSGYGVANNETSTSDVIQLSSHTSASFANKALQRNTDASPQTESVKKIKTYRIKTKEEIDDPKYLRLSSGGSCDTNLTIDNTASANTKVSAMSIAQVKPLESDVSKNENTLKEPKTETQELESKPTTSCLRLVPISGETHKFILVRVLTDKFGNIIDYGLPIKK